MGWNLNAETLEGDGVIVGAPRERWNRLMLRFARPMEDGRYQVDPYLAVEAIDKALEILRAVARTGGTPEFVGNIDTLNRLLNLGVPVLDPSASHQKGLLTERPPSEERLARLMEWPSLVDLAVDQEIEAARLDIVRERGVTGRWSASGFYEQPDVIVVVGDEASPELIAEAKQTGIPVIATVLPESDPTGIFWPIPGDYHNPATQGGLTFYAYDALFEGRAGYIEQINRLTEYGEVRFPSVSRFQDKKSRKQLRARLARPQSVVDADEVIAAWDR
jgi:small subunit ribosomal protein S2